MGVDKQVDIAAIVVPGATTNLRGGGESRRRGGEGIREKDTLELRLTDRNH